jgi:hypothetical protein
MNALELLGLLIFVGLLVWVALATHGGTDFDDNNDDT